ncbi:MAG: hypothetical protein HYR48_05320 [Gemmatimonadetes bacterium]|nr:hypothetical protein [Gemmatimonadota bacterium]
MNPKLYGKLVGAVLVVVGVVGFIVPDLLGMDLGVAHSLVHVGSGALLAVLGFGTASQDATKTVVLIFGVVYTLLGIVGFFMDSVVPKFPIYETGALVNVIHLAVGLLGLAAALMGGKPAAAAA